MRTWIEANAQVESLGLGDSPKWELRDLVSSGEDAAQPSQLKPDETVTDSSSSLNTALRAYHRWIKEEFHRVELGRITSWGRTQGRKIGTLIGHHRNCSLASLNAEGVESLIAYWCRRPMRKNGARSVSAKSSSSYVTLFDYFSDLEDADTELSFTVRNTNSALFSTLAVQEERQVARRACGECQPTVASPQSARRILATAPSQPSWCKLLRSMIPRTSWCPPPSPQPKRTTRLATITIEASQLGQIQAIVTDGDDADSAPAHVRFGNQAPQIMNFQVVELPGGGYEFSGTVVDESAEGLLIEFGGLLAGKTAVIDEDNTFIFVASFPPGTSGTVTAHTMDWWDVASNIASTAV